MKKKVVIEKVPSSKKKVVIEGLPKAQVGTRVSPKRRAQLAIDPLNQFKPKTAADFIQSPEVEGKDFSQSPYRLGFSPELYDRTQNQHNQDVMWNTLDKQGISVPEIKGAPNFKKTITTPQVHAYDFYDPTPEVEKQQRQKKIRKPSNVNYKMGFPHFYPLVGNRYLQEAVMDFNDAATYASNIGKQPKDVTLPPATYNPYVNMYYGADGGKLPKYQWAGEWNNSTQPSYATPPANLQPLNVQMPAYQTVQNPQVTPPAPTQTEGLQEIQLNKDNYSGSSAANPWITAGAIAGTVAKIGSGITKGIKGGLDIAGTNLANRAAQQAENQLYTQSVFSDAMNVTPYETQGYGFLGRNSLAADGMQIREIGGKGEPNVEVEGDEHIQLPNGFSQEIKGKKHSEGGIPMNLPQGTKIFSEKLKDPATKKSYADLAKKFETKKYVDMLNSPDADPIQKATAQLMIKQKNQKLEELFALQEQNKLSGAHGEQVQFNAMQEQQEAMAQEQEPMMMHGGYHLPMYENAGKTGKKIVKYESNPDGTKVRAIYSDGTKGKPQEYVSKRPSQSAYQPTIPTWAIENQVPATNVPATQSTNKQAPRTSPKTRTVPPRIVNAAYQQPSVVTSSNQAFPPYGGINIKPVGFMTPQGPITEETGFNIQNAPTWAQRDLTEWDKAYGFDPGYIQSLAEDPNVTKRYGALPGKDPVAGLYQEYMYDYHLDKLQYGTPEEKEKAKQALRKMWEPTGSTRHGLKQGIKGKNIDFDKAGYEEYASLRPSFIDAIGQYRYLEPFKKPAESTTVTEESKKEPEQQPGTPPAPQVINKTIEMPGMNLGIALPNVYERMPLNYYKIQPQYIDPRYLDIQPQLNRIGRAQRAIESTLGSRGASDMANLLQAQANRAAAEQEAFGTKYNYDRAQDAAAQQFNAQAKQAIDQYNQQSWYQQLEDPIRRRESLIGTQQMMDEQAAIENARKMQAFYGNKEFIGDTFYPAQNTTLQDLFGTLGAANLLKQYQANAVKESKASKDEETETTPKEKYGGKVKKKVKIKLKLRK